MRKTISAILVLVFVIGILFALSFLPLLGIICGSVWVVMILIALFGTKRMPTIVKWLFGIIAIVLFATTVFFFTPGGTSDAILNLLK